MSIQCIQYNLPFDKVVTIGNGYFSDGWQIMFHWADDNLEGRVSKRFNTDTREVECFFKSETDLMAFKLLWE